MARAAAVRGDAAVEKFRATRPRPAGAASRRAVAFRTSAPPHLRTSAPPHLRTSAVSHPLHRSAERLRKLFDAGHRLTKAEAAEQLGLDAARSITRLVHDLRLSGVPVRDEPDPADGRRKRFFLADEDQRRGLRLDALSEAEILALTVAAEAARSALRETPLGEPMASAFQAILDAAREAGDGLGTVTFDPDDEPDHWHFGGAATPPHPAVFASLRRAITDGRRVRVDYTDKRGTRTDGREISPLGFGLVRGAWQLAAWCHLRRALRDFALAAVSHVAVTGAAAHAPDGFDLQAHFAARFGALAGGEPVEVRLRVSADRAVHFRRRRYHPSQRLAEQPDGSLVATYRVPGGDALDEVRAFVASWGPHVVAEAPPALVGRLAEDARQSAEAYGVR